MRCALITGARGTLGGRARSRSRVPLHQQIERHPTGDDTDSISMSDEPFPITPRTPWSTSQVLAVGLGIALIVVPGAGSAFFATGRIDIAAPLVCPVGTVRTHVERVVTEEIDGIATNDYLDCIDGAGHAYRVSTGALIATLYGLMALPGVVLALLVGLLHSRGASTAQLRPRGG